MKNLQEKKVNSRSPGRSIRYNDYAPEERVLIRSTQLKMELQALLDPFFLVGSKRLPESTARRLKMEYLRKMKELVKDSGVVGGSGDDGITQMRMGHQ